MRTLGRLVLLFMIIGCTKSPCSGMETKTREDRVKKAECEIGEYCVRIGQCK